MSEQPGVPLKSELFLKSSDQFRRALRRVINQSGVAADGEARPVTRQALSASADIAASTINKLLVSDDKARAEPPNPTLEVICKLGEALNVSPALLLMTEDDWKKLASAMVTYMTVLAPSEKFRDFVTQTRLNNDYTGIASNVAKDAQEIAKMCGFGLRATEAAKTTIAATSQTLPIRDLNPEHRPLLMVICAIFALSAQQHQPLAELT
ncbi:hypothetical protein [Pantoea sp. 18069]|uniref:hypothetical protein n=1 Tax=Pantoea sp. 18069 TaxID=2681415 RepID=UPI00135AE22E|nr:hypothetical protein [Pantoea sp. 18069]